MVLQQTLLAASRTRTRYNIRCRRAPCFSRASGARVSLRSIGGLLQLFPHFCYVLEDDASVCGYALAAPSHDVYRRRLLDEWLPLMREKYPRPTGDPEKWSTAEVRGRREVVARSSRGCPRFSRLSRAPT